MWNIRRIDNCLPGRILSHTSEVKNDFEQENLCQLRWLTNFKGYFKTYSNCPEMQSCIGGNGSRSIKGNKRPN